MKLRNCLTGICLAVVASSQAVNLNLTLATTAHNDWAFKGYMRDTSNGMYYTANSYIGTSMNSYATTADFLSNSNSTSITLADNHLGTYHVAKNGKIFTRFGSNTGSVDVGRFDATTGVLETSATFSNYDGSNGTATFDWGGYSGLNLFDAGGSGTWMVARHLDGNWHILGLNSSLGITADYTYGNATLGYGFGVGNYLFLGSSFFSPTFTSRVNLTNGQIDSVNFTFVGPAGFLYLSNMFYDGVADRLYVSNAGTYPDNPGLYVLDNAASQLSVPEPISTLTLAFGASIVVMRRRRSK